MKALGADVVFALGIVLRSEISLLRRRPGVRSLSMIWRTLPIRDAVVAISCNLNAFSDTSLLSSPRKARIAKKNGEERNDCVDE